MSIIWKRAGLTTASVLNRVFASLLNQDSPRFPKYASVQKNHKASTATLYLPTQSAIALWESELKGQISDGMWENTNVRGHWEFWHDCNVKLGPPHLESNVEPPKSGYRFSSLIEHVGDRMLAFGRMGKMTTDLKMIEAAEWLPDTQQEYAMILSGQRRTSDAAMAHIKAVPEDVAQKFYETPYSLKDMKNDLMAIRTAMRTRLTERDSKKKPATYTDPREELNGKVVVLTGKPPKGYNKADIAKILNGLGATVESSFTARTQVVMFSTEQTDTTKFQKAKSMGVATIPYEAVL